MEKKWGRMTRTQRLAGTLTILLLFSEVAAAQVFPPRSSQPTPSSPVPYPGQPGQMPMQPAPAPQPSGPPGSLAKTFPFITLLGDPTKAFIQIGNMRTPTDTNFLVGRGLAGRITLEKYIHEAGNGKPVVLHVNGLSNPPIVSTEGTELHLQFVIPSLVFKTYYQDYSAEGDGKLGDVTAEKVTVDVYFTPTIDQRMLPTYHSARVVLNGEIKEPEKCTYLFEIIFPVNVCSLAKEYLKAIKPAIENGLREGLLQPQTRGQFEQQVFQFIRAELLMQAGLNPMSRAQAQILQSSFQGTDYLVNFIPRP
jgi:hypothetical protein